MSTTFQMVKRTSGVGCVGTVLSFRGDPMSPNVWLLLRKKLEFSSQMLQLLYPSFDDEDTEITLTFFEHQRNVVCRYRIAGGLQEVCLRKNNVSEETMRWWTNKFVDTHIDGDMVVVSASLFVDDECKRQNDE